MNARNVFDSMTQRRKDPEYRIQESRDRRKTSGSTLTARLQKDRNTITKERKDEITKNQSFFRAFQFSCFRDPVFAPFNFRHFSRLLTPEF